MKNYKRILAGVLAGTMVMGSSMVVLADNGSTTGEGQLEGTVGTDVFSVVLPTLADPDTTFDFILDPEGLIAATSGDRYTGKTFEDDATLFFANTAAGAANDYSSTSDALEVVNKSSIAVDVSLSATVTGADGITLSEDETFTDDTSASMYLAIKDADGETAITASGAAVSKQMAAATNAYEIKWNDTEGKYEYALKDSVTDTAFEKYSFQLTGASNKAGNWSNLAEVTPSVEVVWNVVAHSDSYLSATSVTSSANTITLSMPEGVTVSGVTLHKTAGTDVQLNSTHYTIAEGAITFAANVITNNVGSTVEIAFSNGKTETVSFN